MSIDPHTLIRRGWKYVMFNIRHLYCELTSTVSDKCCQLQKPLRFRYCNVFFVPSDGVHLHIEAETKLLLFRWRHFQVHFLGWKCMVQIMALRRPGDNPLSEPMVLSLLRHISFTRPQWVKHVPFARRSFNLGKVKKHVISHKEERWFYFTQKNHITTLHQMGIKHYYYVCCKLTHKNTTNKLYTFNNMP